MQRFIAKKKRKRKRGGGWGRVAIRKGYILHFDMCNAKNLYRPIRIQIVKGVLENNLQSLAWTLTLTSCVCGTTQVQFVRLFGLECSGCFQLFFWPLETEKEH